METAKLISKSPETTTWPFLLAEKEALAAIGRYGTDDVFELCKRAGVQLDYQHWPLVTIGECEYDPPTIRVNLAALNCIEATDLGIARRRFEQSIVAHELGHLFLAKSNDAAATSGSHSANLLTAYKTEEFAHGFAVELLRLSLVEQQQICTALRFLRAAISCQMVGACTEIAQENSPRYA